MKNWRAYEDKVRELREYLEQKYTASPNVEVSLLLPGESGFQHDVEIPYISVKYYLNEDSFHERKVELFEHYLIRDIKDIISLITDLIEEFIMEVEQAEYGGG
ncbi:MAG: dephospho-CoA kinase [Aquificaceae bacterium]